MKTLFAHQIFSKKSSNCNPITSVQVSDHHLWSRSSQSKIKEKKAEKGVSIKENVLTSFEPLLEEPAINDHELKSFVESDSDVGSKQRVPGIHIKILC